MNFINSFIERQNSFYHTFSKIQKCASFAEVPDRNNQERLNTGFTGWKAEASQALLQVLKYMGRGFWGALGVNGSFSPGKLFSIGNDIETCGFFTQLYNRYQ